MVSGNRLYISSLAYSPLTGDDDYSVLESANIAYSEDEMYSHLDNSELC